MNTQELENFYKNAGQEHAVIENFKHGKWIKCPRYSPTIASKKEEWRVTIDKPKYVNMGQFIGTQVLCEFHYLEDIYFGFLKRITDKGYIMDGYENEPFPKCTLVKKFWNHLEGIRLPDGVNGIVQVKSGAILPVSKVESWLNVLSYSSNGLLDGWSYKVYE